MGHSVGIFSTRLLDFQVIKNLGSFMITRALDNVIATSVGQKRTQSLPRYEKRTGNFQAGIFVTPVRRT